MKNDNILENISHYIVMWLLPGLAGGLLLGYNLKPALIYGRMGAYGNLGLAIVMILIMAGFVHVQNERYFNETMP